MNIERAREIIEEVDRLPYVHHTERPKNRILNGLKILEKYYGELDMAAEHDEIFVGGVGGYDGGFEGSVTKMTEEDFRELLLLGWHEQDDSWHHFV